MQIKSGQFDDNSRSRGHFLTLLSKNNRALFSYILSCVGRHAEAEDILQQTLLIMWEKFDTFQQGTSFVAWGKKIAYYRILDHRKKAGRQVILDNDVLQQIFDSSDDVMAKSNDRIQALEGCVKKLKGAKRNLIKMRYDTNLSCKAIAMQTNKSLSAIHKSMTAIHVGLKDCVEKTLKLWSYDL